ncbi:MAG: PilN domain-containing protein [Elusimicrobiota bacterium]
MTKINLIPKEQIPKVEHPEIKIMAIGAGVAVLVVLGFTYTSKVARRSKIQKEIITVDRELAQLQTVIDQIARLKSQRDTVNAKKSALEQLVKTRLVYPILMENMAKILPTGLWLLNLATKSADTKTELSFNATAYDNYIIADLLQTLEDSTIFQNPEISGIVSAVGDKGVPIKQFSIKVDYVNQIWK